MIETEPFDEFSKGTTPNDTAEFWTAMKTSEQNERNELTAFFSIYLE